MTRSRGRWLAAAGLAVAFAATPVVADAESASPVGSASVTTAVLNSAGGDGAGTGIKVTYADGQFQVMRDGSDQLYGQGYLPPNSSLYNHIVLAVGDETNGGTAVVPPSSGLSDTGSGVSVAFWDSIVTTQISDTAFESVLSVTISGLTYTVTMNATYTAPKDYFDLSFRTVVPAGNTAPVRLYALFDTYLGGSDNGPGYYIAPTGCPGNPIVGVNAASGDPVVEAIQYVSGPAWSGYASSYYRDLVFSDSRRVISEFGPGWMTDLPNLIDTDPSTDNAIGVNWNFGATANTYDATARFIFSSELPTDCPPQVDPPTTDPRLPSTGQSSSGTSAIAVMLLLVGGALMVLTARRRSVGH